jgi:hypothetical protein
MLTCNCTSNATTFGKKQLKVLSKMWEDDADEVGGMSYRSVEQFFLKMGSKFYLMTRQVHFLQWSVGDYQLEYQLVEYTVTDRKFATM